MTNEELKNKIIEIINGWAEKAVQSNKFDGASVYNPHNAEDLADTLIASSIGDVGEYKDKDLLCANSVAEMIAACDKCGLSECIGCEHDYTAAQEVKELALSDEIKQYKIEDLEVKCEVLQRDIDNLTRTLEEGNEQFKEVERRAKVAERALQIAVVLGELCAPMSDYIDRAEKELAEVKK